MWNSNRLTVMFVYWVACFVFGSGEEGVNVCGIVTGQLLCVRVKWVACFVWLVVKKKG